MVPAVTAADLVAGARALIEPLTGHTPGEWEMSVTHPTNACANVWCGYTDVATLYGGDSDVPQPADGEPWGPQPIRDANARLTAAAPALRDTVAALADLAEAQAQDNAKLRGLLWYAWHEFNAIRARDGAPRGSDTCCGNRGPTLVSEEWWNTMTESFADAIGKDATTPWPSLEARAALGDAQ